MGIDPNNPPAPERVEVRRAGETVRPGTSARGGLPASTRLVAAMAVAGLSDVLSFWFSFVVPLQIVIDLITATALWSILGFRPALLVGLVAEAIPGLAMFPTWILVVLAYSGYKRTRA